MLLKPRCIHTYIQVTVSAAHLRSMLALGALGASRTAVASQIQPRFISTCKIFSTKSRLLIDGMCPRLPRTPQGPILDSPTTSGASELPYITKYQTYIHECMYADGVCLLSLPSFMHAYMYVCCFTNSTSVSSWCSRPAAADSMHLVNLSSFLCRYIADLSVESGLHFVARRLRDVFATSLDCYATLLDGYATSIA